VLDAPGQPGRLKISEPAPDDVLREEGNPREVLRRLNALGPEVVVVEQVPVVRHFAVGELEVVLETAELQLAHRFRGQPLGRLEVVQHAVRGLPLEALVQRKHHAIHES
jgi:hypothetical protein